MDLLYVANVGTAYRLRMQGDFPINRVSGRITLSRGSGVDARA